MARAPRTDAVIIGAGVAGLAAALELGRKGMTVALVDSSPIAGGTARIAGGGTWIAGSSLQRAYGIDDDARRGLRDWLSWGGADVDSAWASRYVTQSPKEVFEFLSSIGVVWEGLGQREGDSVPRRHVPRGGGRAVMSALERAVRRQRGIHWHLATHVTSLIACGGRVVGARAQARGRDVELLASATLVATGGFCSDAARVRQHIPAEEVPTVLLGGGPHARGDGHRMLQDVGAAFTNLDAMWMYPTSTPHPAVTSPHRGLVVRGLADDVWVNSDGTRFHDERERGGGAGTAALLAQPGAACWAIIDAHAASGLHIADPGYRDGITSSREAVRLLLNTSAHIARAPNIAALAARIGIEGKALAETMRQHDLLSAAGGPHPTSGAFMPPSRSAEPPYFAIRFLPLARKNLGGVLTDDACRVLARPGVAAIPGLFAAGEVAGMAGGRINGRAALEGTMFGPSLYSGRVAGRAMLTA